MLERTQPSASDVRSPPAAPVACHGVSRRRSRTRRIRYTGALAQPYEYLKHPIPMPSGHGPPCKLDLRARADGEKSDGAGRDAGGEGPGAAG